MQHLINQFLFSLNTQPLVVNYSLQLSRNHRGLIHPPTIFYRKFKYFLLEYMMSIVSEIDTI